MQKQKMWFEEVESPYSPKHVKQWGEHGLPIQAKHKIGIKEDRFEIAKNFVIVKRRC